MKKFPCAERLAGLRTAEYGDSHALYMFQKIGIFSLIRTIYWIVVVLVGKNEVNKCKGGRGYMQKKKRLFLIIYGEAALLCFC
jgi:hypothetical protein